MTHPTDDEIMELAGSWFHTGENQKRDDGYYYRSLGTPSNVRGSDLIEFARALLAEQARTEPDLAPGVMRCARCKFRLNRINLNFKKKLYGRLNFRLGRIRNNTEYNLLVLVRHVGRLFGDLRRKQHLHQTFLIHPSISSNLRNAPTVTTTLSNAIKLTGSAA